MDRFFHRDLSPESLELDETEGHHLARVLRKGVGEQVMLFDGQGGSVLAQVARIGKKTVTLTRTAPVAVDPLPARRVCVASAVPKGERFKWMIEKLTETGVDELQLLSTQRSVTEPGGQRLEKLEQQVIAACKQCGRNRLLEIRPIVDWTTFLDKVSAALYLCDARGTPVRDLTLPAATDSVAVAIGPEGGWTDAELESGRNSKSFVDTIALSSYILRVETAAILGGGFMRLA